jgi:hypothetical protein
MIFIRWEVAINLFHKSAEAFAIKPVPPVAAYAINNGKSHLKQVLHRVDFVTKYTSPWRKITKVYLFVPLANDGVLTDTSQDPMPVGIQERVFRVEPDSNLSHASSLTALLLRLDFISDSRRT